jgi:hypothetical protein
MSEYKVFLIPFESVPADPPYAAWFATWSRERPKLEPGMNVPMVVGVTTQELLPIGAVLLTDGTKDPQPPPPPPPPDYSMVDYQKSVTTWMMMGRPEDEE